jgi:hypothetical protein
MLPKGPSLCAIGTAPRYSNESKKTTRFGGHPQQMRSDVDRSLQSGLSRIMLSAPAILAMVSDGVKRWACRWTPTADVMTLAYKSLINEATLMQSPRNEDPDEESERAQVEMRSSISGLASLYVPPDAGRRVLRVGYRVGSAFGGAA